MANNIVPTLRFLEFSGDWSSDKLGSIATFSKGKGISKSDIDLDGETECIRYGELYTTYAEIITEIVSKTNLDSTELILSEENDVIIPSSGETQIDIATASCVVKSGVALGGDLNIIKSPANGIFLSYYLNNARKNDIASLAQGISVVHLYANQLATLTVNIPSQLEQIKIANFLTDIDKRINLLQKKKVELEQYKKGVMQKLFSQTIRFKKDDGSNFSDWEGKKLGEIGSFQTSSVDKLSKENEKQVYLVNYMNVYRHENINNATRENLQIVTAKENQIKSSDLRKGDILFTPSSETPTDIGHSVVIFENLEDTLFSYHLMRFRPNIKLDLLYSHYFCNTPSVLKQLSSYSTGSTRFTISVGNFSKINVKIPSFDEQQKIANFLSSIDKSIEIMNEQIDNSVAFKKGLLQKMFV